MPWRWLLAAGWIGIVLVASRPALGAWGNAWRAWGDSAWSGTVGPGLLLVPLRHLGLIMLAGVFAAACAGPGGVLRGLLPPVASGRRALGLLLGFAIFGAWHLGLALVGVFHPLVLGAGVLAALALPGGRGLPGALVRVVAQVRRTPGSPWWWGAAFAAVVVPLLGSLVPDAHVDALTYHLAIPEQVLFARKYTFEGAGLTHLFPLTAELNYALAIMIGADALPHLLQLVPFVAAVGLLAGWAAERGGPAAGWLAALLALTWGETGRQLGIAKNDLAAAAYPMAAAMALARAAGGDRGWLLMSALLAGCGAATKTSGWLTGAVLAAIVPVVRHRVGVPWRWVAVAALPLVPWAVRAWLMTGDPVWPALAGHLPGALWDDVSARALAVARGVGDPASRLRGLVTGARGLSGEHPALAIMLPVALWRAWIWSSVDAFSRPVPVRLLLGWAVVATAGFWWMMPGEWMRLSLAPALVVAAVAASAAPRLFAAVALPARPWLLAAGVVLTWVPLGRTIAETTDPATSLRVLTGAISGPQALALRRSTLHETGEAMRRLPRLRRVIGFGDIRGYRLPGRFVAERCFGRTHAWVFAGESANAGRVRVRFRQLGATHVIHNFVTEAFPHPHAAPFGWDGRRLRVWREFVGRHLEIVVRPRHVDHVNGGFVVYAVRDRPLLRAPDRLAYLPGIESLYYEVARHDLSGDLGGWMRAAAALDARVPNVDCIHDFLGIGYRIAGRWREAYAAFSVGVNRGTVNDANVWDLAVCAFHLGRYEEAFRLFNRAIEITPGRRADAEPAFAVFRRVLARP